MHLRISIILLTILFLIESTIIYAQENYIVRDISFVGIDSLKSDNILEEIQHYPTGWFSDVILFNDPYLFSNDIFQKDKERILNYYQREGFLFSTIESVNFSKDDEGKTVEIEIEINENNPIIVDSLEISIDDEILKKSIHEIKEKLKLKDKIRFRDKLIEIDKNTIVNSFINNGYPYVDVKYDLSLDTNKSTVGINWNVTLGKLSKFGEITFEGNKRTERELLKNKVSFESGDIYDGSELERTQKYIYNLGLFYIVSVNAEFSENKSDIIPIKIILEEAPKLTTKLGIGYGREEKFRISIDERWLAFLGGARQLKLYMKHSSLEPYNIRLNFLQPDFISEHNTLSVTPFLLRQTEPGFTINRLGAEFSLQRPLFFDILGSIKYSFERSNLDTNSISEIEREKYKIDQLYNKSSIELGFERISSEPIFNPEKGTFSSVALYYSGLGLGSKYHFLRPSIDFRKYIALNNWLIFAFKVKAGAILCYDNDGFVPIEERFYSGGSSSIRGWGRAELGRQDAKGIPLGGKSLFESNLEFRFPIYSIVYGVTFLDFGNVWETELTYKINDLRYSPGLGIRIKTPIGPIRFDVAIPVFEGAAKVQYFISVGHAF